jgi:hypothetical protein
MPQTAVLAIGLDPRLADFSAMPGLTPALVRAYVEAEIDRVRALGYAVEMRLLAPGDAAEAELEALLGARRFDCVLIGAGLREPPERLLLFERILNLIHRLAPAACIAFNAAPADSAEAIGRWIAPQQG